LRGTSHPPSSDGKPRLCRDSDQSTTQTASSKKKKKKTTINHLPYPSFLDRKCIHKNRILAIELLRVIDGDPWGRCHRSTTTRFPKTHPVSSIQDPKPHWLRLHQLDRYAPVPIPDHLNSPPMISAKDLVTISSTAPLCLAHKSRTATRERIRFRMRELGESLNTTQAFCTREVSVFQGQVGILRSRDLGKGRHSLMRRCLDSAIQYEAHW